MKKTGMRFSTRLLSMLLAVMLPAGAIPFTSFAKEVPVTEAAAAEYAVTAHGGIIKNEKSTTVFTGVAKAGTVLEIAPDEEVFGGHDFVCWRGDDGTEIPKKSFRLLVERDCAFYPVFSDLTGEFGDWQELVCGELCTDGVIYVREDMVKGLKEYRFEEGSHNYQCEQIDGDTHRVSCTKCPYVYTENHNWNSGVITTEAAHTTDGEKTYTCYDCNAVKTEVVPAKTDDHSYPMYPNDDDWVVISEPDGMTPGLRKLKCSYCDETKEPEQFITSSLPQKNVKITYEYISVGSHSREEIHYIGEDSYYFYVDRKKCPYSFGFLYFDEGENSPVYIRSVATSVERYGDAGGPNWGILGYVDSYGEFVKLITNFNNGIYVGDNGLDVAMLYSTISGCRAFEEVYNEVAKNGMPDNLRLVKENVTQSGFPGKTFRTYEYTGGYSPVEYLVDENNACFSRFTDAADYAKITSMEPFEQFPFTKSDRNEITWYSYYVSNGSYNNKYYDSNYFNMTHIAMDDENIIATPREAPEGQVFSHWEKYDPYTWEWSFYSNSYTVKPDKQDVTTLRAVYKDITYHIKVNGGCYQEVVSGDWTTGGQKFTEGNVKAGTRICLVPDLTQTPEGKEVAGIVDAAGTELGNYWFTPAADGEYTVTYTDKRVYVNAYADNGSIYKDGEEFGGDRIRIGDSITLTTESSGEEYPYFLGWYLVRDNMGETVYELLSDDTTLTYTVPDRNSVDIRARWHNAPEIPDYKFTVNSTNGFLRKCGAVSVAVSDLRVSNGTDIIAIKDPDNPLVIRRWRLTGTLDNGTESSEEVGYQDPDTWIYLENSVDGGGKGGGDVSADSEQRYPWNITITGEADICTEHDWDDGVVTKQPTYVDYGELTSTCRVCGTQKTEPVPMLARYCVHACGNCGGCTLETSDTSCNFTRCTCENRSVLPTQNGPVLDFSHNGSGSISPEVYTVLYEEQTENPYVQYVLQAADGYEIKELYDISFKAADGNKYTPADGETVTITLTVGAANAQAVAGGRMFIVHITDNGNVIYGSGYEPITADAGAGTVTFTVDSFSPFLLVKNVVEYHGTVTSFLNDTDNVKIELIPSGETTAAYSTTVNGRNADYSIPDVEAGAYTMRVSKPKHVTREYTVTVGAGNVAQDVKIHLQGDINGDGQVDTEDWNRVYNHVNEKTLLSGYELECAEVTGDSKVNMKDWNRIYAHVNEMTPLW